MNLYGMVSDKKAFAGMLFGMNPKSVVTYIADGVVDYGMGLFAKDGKVKSEKTEGSTFAGVAVFHQNSYMNSCGSYIDKEAVASLNDGNIWGVVADAEDSGIKDGATAYVTPAGKFTSEANDGESEPTAYDVVGKFKSGIEDGLALVDISK